MDTKSQINRKIRIAFIGQKGIPLKFGGIEAYVENVVERLPQDRFDISVYVRPWYTPNNLTEYKGVHLIHVPCIHSKYLDAFTHVLLCSLHCIFKGFDVIHYQGIGPSFFCWIPRLFGKKTILTIHGLPQLSSKWSPFAKAFLRFSEQIGISFAHEVIVISRTLQQEFEARTSRRDITYIPNAVEVPATDVTPEIISRKYGLQGQDYLLFLGRISPEKRLEWVVKAFKDMTQKDGGRKLKLIIAGAAKDGDAYEVSIKKLCKDDDRIVFTQWVTGREKGELLRNAFLFVLPSYMEGLPTALLEAMSFGVPCLVSDIPSHKEVVRDTKNGFLFDYRNFEDFQNVLSGICLHKEQSRGSIGIQARQTIQEEYNVEKSIRHLSSLYDSLVRVSPKICLVSSSGGHLYQLYVLKPFWEKYRRVWVTFKKTDAESLLRDEQNYWAYFPTTRSIKALFHNLWLAFHVLRRERPDIIISTGAAVAVPFFVLAKLFNAKTVYIEVFDRIAMPTLTGKLVYPLCDAFVIQWEEQRKFYPKGKLLGQVL